MSWRTGIKGECVMFAPPGHVSLQGFFGIDGLRIFLPKEGIDCNK